MRFTAPTQGRKSAYFARNRETLILATQIVLAKKGSEVKLEDIAAEADMAVSTIYKHFPNREELLEASIVEAMHQWERDTFAAKDENIEPLVQLVRPMKAFLNMKQTHPLFAKLVANNRDLAYRLAPLTAGNLVAHVKQLVADGKLKIDSPELRTRNLIACLFAALEDQLINPKAKESENLKSLNIALGMIGIPPAEAEKLLSL
jgi:AcrR family transcriptional regulator